MGEPHEQQQPSIGGQSSLLAPPSWIQIQAFSEVPLGEGLASIDTTQEDEAFQIELIELGPEHRDCKLIVYQFHGIELVKRMLLKRLHLQRVLKITDIIIYYNGIELPNHRMMSSFASYADATVTLHWRVKDKIAKGITVRGIRERGGTKILPKHRKLLQEIQNAFSKKINPKLTMEGTGGTYFLYNTNNKPIAIFKPSDEEAFAPNNPRGYIGRFGQPGFRAGVVSGEGSIREVAAFLLDAYYGGFSSIPATCAVEMIHPHFCYDPSNPSVTRKDDVDLWADGLLRRKKKRKDQDQLSKSINLQWKSGSLQEFVSAKDSSSDYDPRMFSVGDAHKIGILDIRLANMDRNDGNILVVKAEDVELFGGDTLDLLYPPFVQERPEYQERALQTVDGTPAKLRLIPIDHGLTLPDCLDITDFDLAWLNWPQSHVPLLPAELEYIDKLKPDTDAEWLSSKLSLRPACLRVMQVTTRLLKKGVKKGLTLYQIAMLMVRLSPSEPSALERVVKLAVSQACYASFATSLVHKRNLGSMKYVMDLAGVTETKKIVESTDNASGGSRSKIRFTGDPPSREMTSASRVNFDLRLSGQRDLLGDGSSEKVVGMRPRSKTLSRLPDSSNSLTKSRGTKLRKLNYTALRERDETQSLNSLWILHDTGGRVVNLDWSEKRFQRLFFESFDGMLDFLLAEKFGGSATGKSPNQPDGSTSIRDK
eukprot:Blabericola_migrator_1__11437@NODE_67_length_15652_cov_76_134937_g60_i0_p3_GENE_NODE_67_length_15652_cov_76_134937_g60_i0NODE_67_length_15652_cov_76_134937_g60_i0_p3_ORF_typecomplete_len708_score106_77PI3_PI4_kinase/PF00454_27/8_7e18_NODE_67_length_15652_cov_76_134937_g60_i0791410037